MRVVSVALLDDDVEDPGESFALRLTAPANATLAMSRADGRIEDNDQMATLSVTGGRGVEGGTIGFVVTLTGSTGGTVSVDYATADGTAVAGEDYEAASGTATFASGERETTVSVMLLSDDLFEPEEHFELELSSAVNATVAVGVAAATILDGTGAGKASTKGHVLLFESADHPQRQGFVRVINHSDQAGEVLVEAIDGSGLRLGPVALAVGAGTATHFNSDDLEEGNALKGLPDGVGPAGEGAWRLELSSELDIEVLSYARTVDGFVTSLHDTAPDAVGVHRAVFVNPGRNFNQVSRLRLVNPGPEDAQVTITGTDDQGMTSPDVVVEVPAGTTREWTAAELESGTGTQGALGMGDGKWRLRLSSDWPVVVLSLIQNPTGHLTNLSTLPRPPDGAEQSHWVRLFPSASDPLDRQGFVRVVNGTVESADVTIKAVDTTDWDYASLTLAVGVDQVASFNSDDLEMGNEAKGLAGSTGAGQGHWMLELTSAATIEVLAYVRTNDGFVTAMHDVVPEAEGIHRVVFFNPASNVNQVSVLRIINAGSQDAEVRIEGVDDSGASPGTPVLATVAAGRALELTSPELETGESAAITGGALGDGLGKWRLDVTSDQPLVVMSLLSNPTGHLTNLSTATDRGEVQDTPP